VLDIGPRFFLLALVSDRIRFDGFECFRLSDVRNVRPDPYTTFAETALRKRGERIPKKSRVSAREHRRVVALSEPRVPAGDDPPRAGKPGRVLYRPSDGNRSWTRIAVGDQSRSDLGKEAE
jgi:hypothetical protein